MEKVTRLQTLSDTSRRIDQLAIQTQNSVHILASALSDLSQYGEVKFTYIDGQIKYFPMNQTAPPIEKIDFPSAKREHIEMRDDGVA